MAEFLVEIGTEEIPARFVEDGKSALIELLMEALDRERIIYKTVEIFATPRRFAIFIHDVEPYQRERSTIKYGPPISRAFGEDGTPKKEAIAFARANNVSVEELKRFIKDGREVIGVERKEESKEAKEVIPSIIKEIIIKTPFPKKMRWGMGIEFPRPIRWVLCLFDQTPLRFSMNGIESNNFTFGHRFLSYGKIVVEDVRSYVEKLKRAFVIVNEEERIKMIKDGIQRIEEETNAKAKVDEALLKEILYITEYPYAMKGSFDPSFLSLPEDVIINVMKSHQRYIPLERKGKLIPDFIFFANTVPKDENLIKKGNEKVLKARLEDAKFYFEEDRKVNLYELYEKLDGLIFHFRLGSMKEKVERIRNIAGFLSSYLSYKDNEKIERAIRLIKSDLLTHMVREFPELQGKIGRIYAQLQGEDKEVSRAVEEHYLPLTKQDPIPQTTLGMILSIADKIDTLSAFFSEGIIPKGDKDPFGLRRQALGIIRILMEKGINISLETLISFALKTLNKRDEAKGDVIDFIKTRLRFYLIEEGRRQDLVDSILSFAGIDIYDALKRLEALEEKSKDEDFKILLTGFKRVYNMTKTYKKEGKVDESIFQFEEEKILYELYEREKENYQRLLWERDFSSVLNILLKFKLPIDRFFDKVFVMDKDETIRRNRLNLLMNIRDMFLQYGDFSKIDVSKEEL